MNEKETKILIKGIKSYSKAIIPDPAKAKAFLQNAGIVTKSGNLTKPYKTQTAQEKCISQVQG